jgi:hypothetical protein
VYRQARWGKVVIMADKRKRPRRTVRNLNVASDVNAVITTRTGTGTSSSRQTVRIVQRDGKTVVHDVRVEASPPQPRTADADGAAEESGAP